MKRHSAAVLLAAALAACGLESRTRIQRPALLRASADDSISFVAPDTVLLNQPFSISVTTVGGSCESKGPTDIFTLATGGIEFRPFDITEINDDQTCSLEVQTFNHSGQLTRTSAGPVTITLLGRDWDGTATSRVKTVIVR